ncbi:MAG: serine/threonine-protein kinase [Nostocaceae cyanobacterium]|nr:serine/threonine-protein kinase [Nostocaceae cyanobacterium]
MLEIGQILCDRYQLKQKLSQNAGRQTWLAEDLANEPAEQVIIKFLAFGDQVQWEDLKLFEREANVLKQLYHPRIPKYRDYFSIEDRILWFCLVQQYIPGTSLKDLLSEGRKFTESEVIKIATDVLEILSYLHNLNPPVLHRDIKPSNLILGSDEQLYIVDFGAVQDRAASAGATFTVVGTYGYAPMEQFGGRSVPASDLYALGATLIHLVTGTAPADLPQKNMQIQFQDKVSLSKHFVRWLEGLTQPDIEQRFSSANQALEALNNRLATQSSDLVYHLEGSQIEIKKSPKQLEITIPGRSLKLYKYQNFFVYFLYSLFLLSIFAWLTSVIPVTIFFLPILKLLFTLAGLSIFIIFLLRNFGEVYISFNDNYFLIDWTFASVSYRQQQGKTRAINDIYIREFKVNNKYVQKIIIESKNKEYTFGGFIPGLTDAEYEWLVVEMRDWLGLQEICE